LTDGDPVDALPHLIVARSRAVYTALAPNRFQGLLAGVSGIAARDPTLIDEVTA
jgi:hypothetical protein